jgi:hypothetical protein
MRESDLLPAASFEVLIRIRQVSCLVVKIYFYEVFDFSFLGAIVRSLFSKAAGSFGSPTGIHPDLSLCDIVPARLAPETIKIPQLLGGIFQRLLECIFRRQEPYYSPGVRGKTDTHRWSAFQTP